MILFKYVSPEAGAKILETNSIGYSSPNYFNDPFEVTCAFSEDATDPIRQFLAKIRHDAKTHAWRNAVAILCLTRSPLNPLMWAHYADSHKGFVIGFDVALSGFADESANLVPAHYGSVVYTNTREPGPPLSSAKATMRIAREYSFRPELGEKLQRLFLQKSSHWAYEEEVRVVKCIASDEDGGESVAGSESLRTIQVQGRPLHIHDLPKDAVREVYFGMRNELGKDHAFLARLAETQSSAALFACKMQRLSWTIEAHRIQAG